MMINFEESLRLLLQNQGQETCFLLKSGDEFLAEYPVASLNRLERLLGFTGSAGVAIFTFRAGRLCKYFLTDSRYLLQAPKQLDGFEVINMQTKPLLTFLAEAGIKTILTNTKLCSINFAEAIGVAGIELSDNNLDEDLLQINYKNISGEELLFYSGEAEEAEVFGKTRVQKLQILSEYIKFKRCDAMFLHDPLDVNYILNIRGNDFACVPALACFAFVMASGDFVLLKNNDLYTLPQFLTRGFKVLIGSSASFYCKQLLLQNGINPLLTKDSFVEGLRSVKNQTEIAHQLKACVKDSLVLNRFLQDRVINRADIAQQTEASLADELFAMRSEADGFLQNSFDTISAFGANGAVVHYKPSKNLSANLSGDGLYLLDSGAHYKYGTTDITRTVLIGKARQEWITNFTLVLKGHIAIASLIFKQGTSGADIDALARQHLWASGLDYGHGTGHGVGFLLSVHEGPCGISRGCKIPLAPGMVISNEPGYYKQDEYGIRLENLLLVEDSHHQGFLQFKTITFVDFDDRLIDYQALDAKELDWLLKYRGEVKNLR